MGLGAASHTADPALARLIWALLLCLGTVQIGLPDKTENAKCYWDVRKQGMIFQHKYIPNIFMEHTFILKKSFPVYLKPKFKWVSSIFICKIWQCYPAIQTPSLAPKTQFKRSPGQCWAFDLADLLKSWRSQNKRNL